MYALTVRARVGTFQQGLEMERTGLEPASTATFRKRASLLPASRRELPPSRTVNSFQCFRNLLPVGVFRERREATFYPTQQTRSSFWEPLFQSFYGAIPLRRPPHNFARCMYDRKSGQLFSLQNIRQQFGDISRIINTSVMSSF